MIPLGVGVIITCYPAAEQQRLIWENGDIRDPVLLRRFQILEEI